MLYHLRYNLILPQFSIFFPLNTENHRPLRKTSAPSLSLCGCVCLSEMATLKSGRKYVQRQGFWRRRYPKLLSRRFFRLIIVSLAFVTVIPPIFFHFRLRWFHQVPLSLSLSTSNPLEVNVSILDFLDDSHEKSAM